MMMAAVSDEKNAQRRITGQALSRLKEGLKMLQENAKGFGALETQNGVESARDSAPSRAEPCRAALNGRKPQLHSGCRHGLTVQDSSVSK